MTITVYQAKAPEIVFENCVRFGFDLPDFIRIDCIKGNEEITHYIKKALVDHLTVTNKIES